MNLRKRIMLGASAIIITLIAIVITILAYRENNKRVGNVVIPPPSEDNTNEEVEPPFLYTHKPGEVEFKKGGDVINFEYIPSQNTAGSVAYEYSFINEDENITKGIYIKQLEVQGVDIRYAYAKDEGFDATQEFSSFANFSVQLLPTDIRVFVYIIITPTDDTVSVNFASNIKWISAEATDMEIANNINSVIDTRPIVKGQNLEEPIPNEINGYTFDAWYLDADYTRPAIFPIKTEGIRLYARYHNTPKEMLKYEDGEFVVTYNQNTSKLSTLILPSVYSDGTNTGHVTKIQDRAFANNTNLIKVIVSSSIKHIGNEAFANTKCREIDFNSAISIETIGDKAFNNSLIRNMNLSKCVNLTTLGKEIFKDSQLGGEIDLSACTKLETIGESAFAYSKFSNIMLPKNITNIGQKAFYNCVSLTQINIPNKVETIGYGAFSGCSLITSITLPSGIVSIEDNTFYACVALNKVNLNACVNLTTIGSSAFRYCANLTSITIPNKVQYIKSNAFNSCSSLKNILLSNSLISIDNFAFNGCSSLTEIYIPRNVTSIGVNAFNNTALTSATFENTSGWIDEIGQEVRVKNITTNATILLSGIKLIKD